MMPDHAGDNPNRPPTAMALPHDPAARRRATVLRVVVWAIVGAAIAAAAVQFQVGTMKRDRQAQRFDRENPDWTPAAGLAGGPQRPEDSKGAVGRWREAVTQFWAGYNIYEFPPPDPNASPPAPRTDSAWLGRVYMHPNSPPTVLLLTPFGLMPPWLMAATYNLLKLAMIALSVWMCAQLVSGWQPRTTGDHHGAAPAGRLLRGDAAFASPLPPLALALGVLWALVFLVGDVQHGNTNIFALGAIVLHLWLYRRGRDTLAGLPLALAICIKLTPALFLLYWVWQRNWRLLAGTVVSLAALLVVAPAAVVGPQRYATLTGTWLDNLILPGLTRGAWYPVHINQSLSGAVSRYFLDGPNGDIFWGPDDEPHYSRHVALCSRDPSIPANRWITLVPLSEQNARWLLRAAQIVVVAFLFWAIGWRRLPRDDARRSLHYALIVLAMLLLNQRTWQHHAAVLLPATVAIWAALGNADIPRRTRRVAMGLVIAVGVVLLALRNELIAGIGRLAGLAAKAAERQVDIIDAYGPLLGCFLLLFVAAAILARAARAREA